MTLTLPLPSLSAWDPRATSAGSIDPLGALRAYTAIATALLPGITTITTRARYMSWVCAGLRLLDESGSGATGGQAGRARRQKLLAWERLVALATVRAVREQPGRDAAQLGGLRGVSYVRRAVAEGRCSPDFAMLKNQSGVGGVGTYWVTLVNGGFVDDASAELTDRGSKLADAFLRQDYTPDRNRLRELVAGRPTAFSADELQRWGAVAGLDTQVSSAEERRLLADALLQPPQHRRMASALESAEVATSDAATFAKLEIALRAQAQAQSIELANAVAVACRFEALHTALLDRFDRMRAADVRGRPLSIPTIANLVGDPIELLTLCQALATVLQETANCLSTAVATSVRRFLNDLQPVALAADEKALAVALVAHHMRVQAGKTDASRVPKQAWIELQSEKVVIAPRFALEICPEPRASGSFTHPYRVEQFVGMLSEVGNWQARL